MLFRPLAGFDAGVAALLVAVKQLIPDNEVALLGGALRFRAKVRALNEGHLDPITWVGAQVAIAGRVLDGSRPAAAVADESVAAQRAVPHQPAPSSPPPPAPAQHLPGLYVAAASVAALAVGGAVRVLPFVLLGSYSAWAYLRFIQTRNGVR